MPMVSKVSEKDISFPKISKDISGLTVRILVEQPYRSSLPSSGYPGSCFAVGVAANDLCFAKVN